MLGSLAGVIDLGADAAQLEWMVRNREIDMQYRYIL
jgi:hypothetical protein